MKDKYGALFIPCLAGILFLLIDAVYWPSLAAAREIALPGVAEVSRVDVKVWRRKPVGLKMTPLPTVDQAYDIYEKKLFERRSIKRVVDLLMLEKYDWRGFLYTPRQLNGYIDLIGASGSMNRIDFDPVDCGKRIPFHASDSRFPVQKSFSTQNCINLMKALTIPPRFWQAK